MSVVKGVVVAQPRLSRRWAALATTVGSKLLIALTGLGLVGFVIAHLAGNLQVYQGPEPLNGYAQFLKDQGPLLWLARAGLLAIFLLHLVLTIRLQQRDQHARPIGYAHRSYRRASLASRTMLLSGLVILAFILFHLAHFTFGFIHSADHALLESYQLPSGDPAQRHDVYHMVVRGFQGPVITLTYVIAMGFLGLHLSHGIASTLQTLGLNEPRWHRLAHGAGLVLALILALGNMSIPLAILFGLVK